MENIQKSKIKKNFDETKNFHAKKKINGTKIR